MILTPTELPGVLMVDVEPRGDERGFFARTWCQREAAAAGLQVEWVQFNVSFSRRRSTLRGLHFQRSPHSEGKLVRVTRGAIWDVVVDLRRDSPTFKRYIGVTLSAENHRALYIPPADLAHGYLTLSDDSEVLYHMSAFYSADHSVGIRWDDPAFAIQWPESAQVISTPDASYPDFAD
jgi:dTDP-4-dehydrorhamnose 3,5-epimerase